MGKTKLDYINNTYNSSLEQFSYENIVSKLSRIFIKSKD